MFPVMRTIGSPTELERRRLLAVERVNEGYAPEEVAEFLGVDPSSVRRWVSAFRQDGVAGLAARPVPLTIPIGAGSPLQIRSAARSGH